MTTDNTEARQGLGCECTEETPCDTHASFPNSTTWSGQSPIAEELQGEEGNSSVDEARELSSVSTEFERQARGFLVVGQAERDGNLFVLIDGELGQYIFTQRLDDAEQWAAFVECSVGSITAREIYEFADNWLNAQPVTGTLRAAQGVGVAGEWPDNLYDGAVSLLRSWLAWFDSRPSGWSSITIGIVTNTRALLIDEAARQESAWDDPPRSTSGVFNEPERDKSLVPKTNTSESFSSPDTTELPERVWIDKSEAKNFHSRGTINCYKQPYSRDPQESIEFARVHPRSKGGEGELRIGSEITFPALDNDEHAYVTKIADGYVHYDVTRERYIGEGVQSVDVATRTPSQVESEAAWRPIEVEGALNELREMFPKIHDPLFEVVKQETFGQLSRVHWVVHVWDLRCSGSTLDEAMQKVREWKQSLPLPPQSK